ncbi:MAG: class I SAM-dependent methyltransferase [bacterium]|nr:class I SAM-dependent methyltransferase [bacterium]
MTDSAANIREHWENQASEYTMRRQWSDADERILTLLSEIAGTRLLEIGIGPGVMASAVQRKGLSWQYQGLDFSRKFLSLANQNLTKSIPLALGSAEFLPYQSESFDLVLEMDTIHHFPRALIPRTVKEIVRVLKHDGRFISLEDWALRLDDERSRLIYELQSRRFTVVNDWEYHPSESEWITIFQTAGLVVESVENPQRFLDIAQYDRLPSIEAAMELARLRHICGAQIPKVSMSLFVSRKP